MKFPKIQIQSLQNCSNCNFLTSEIRKLISRKIRVAGKWLDFYTLECPKWKFQIKLLRSVQWPKSKTSPWINLQILKFHFRLHQRGLCEQQTFGLFASRKGSTQGVSRMQSVPRSRWWAKRSLPKSQMSKCWSMSTKQSLWHLWM